MGRVKDVRGGGGAKRRKRLLVGRSLGGGGEGLTTPLVKSDKMIDYDILFSFLF